MRLERFDEAAELFSQNLKMLKDTQNRDLELQTLENLTICKGKQGIMEEAIQCAKEMHKVGQLAGLPMLQVQALLYQFSFLIKLNKVQEAESILQKAEKFAREQKDQRYEPMILFHQALLTKAKGKPSHDLLERALSVVMSCANVPLEAKILENLGDLAMEESTWDLSKKYFHRCLILYEDLSDSFSRIRVLSRLKKLYRITDHPADAAIYSHLALKLAQKLLEKKILSQNRFNEIVAELNRM